MKKVFLAALFALVLGSAFAATEPAAITEKVLKAFSQTFESAQNVRWSEHQGLYEAHFTFNDIQTRVIYDNEGNTLQTIRYYFAQQLPLNILTRVKAAYANQKIYGVTEVTTDDKVEYHIVLESPTNWMIILADNSGYLAEEKKMGKA